LTHVSPSATSKVAKTKQIGQTSAVFFSYAIKHKILFEILYASLSGSLSQECNEQSEQAFQINAF